MVPAPTVTHDGVNLIHIIRINDDGHDGVVYPGHINPVFPAVVGDGNSVLAPQIDPVPVAGFDGCGEVIAVQSIGRDVGPGITVVVGSIRAFHIRHVEHPTGSIGIQHDVLNLPTRSGVEVLPLGLSAQASAQGRAEKAQGRQEFWTKKPGQNSGGRWRYLRAGLGDRLPLQSGGSGWEPEIIEGPPTA